MKDEIQYTEIEKIVSELKKRLSSPEEPIEVALRTILQRMI